MLPIKLIVIGGVETIVCWWQKTSNNANTAPHTSYIWEFCNYYIHKKARIIMQHYHSCVYIYAIIKKKYKI